MDRGSYPRSISFAKNEHNMEKLVEMITKIMKRLEEHDVPLVTKMPEITEISGIFQSMTSPSKRACYSKARNQLADLYKLRQTFS